LITSDAPRQTPCGGFDPAATRPLRRIAPDQPRKMKYTANIQAGDVTITVKQVNRVIIAIASGHCIAVSPDSAFYPLYFNRIEP
jgi:hypothetical protein